MTAEGISEVCARMTVVLAEVIMVVIVTVDVKIEGLVVVVVMTSETAVPSMMVDVLGVGLFRIGNSDAERIPAGGVGNAVVGAVKDVAMDIVEVMAPIGVIVRLSILSGRAEDSIVSVPVGSGLVRVCPMVVSQPMFLSSQGEVSCTLADLALGSTLKPTTFSLRAKSSSCPSV